MATTLTRKLKDGTVKTWTTSGNFKGGKIKKKCRNCNKEIFVFRYRKDNNISCSRSCAAASRTKENSANWRGGVDYENKRARASEEYEKWRDSVYRSDNWICQKCQKKCRKDIVAHHILPFSIFKTLRFNTSNGITLCRSCHKKVHNKMDKYLINMKPLHTIDFNGSNGVLTIV